jgi:predicted RecA/RadA family phage recombinase
MSATFRDNGGRWDHTPSGAVAAGAVLVLGATVAVATSPIAANSLGSVAVRGNFVFPKNSAGGSGSGSTALAQGAKVYWDESEEEMTPVDTSNILAGKCSKAATDADTTVEVELGIV